MKARLAFVLLCAAACGSWVLAQGCGGDDSSQQDATNDGTTGNDSGSGADTGSGSDTGTGNDSGSANDSGSGNDSATGNDSGTTGLTYRCGFGQDAGMVTDCAQCQGFTLPCVFCSTGDGGLEGRCASANFGCQAGNGFGSCPCSAGDASTCPEGFQVCRQGQGNNYACHTCGEFQTNNLTCENGGKCDSADGGCL